ncbi:MAG: Gp15 family bacteriophage protein [Sphaerochaetaceae bacterium]
MAEDWELIESSLAKQYGIRIRQHTDMSWKEFRTLISGLMSDTPLGNIISIRAETDPKAIRGFTPTQRRIHSDWKRIQAQERLSNPEQLDKDMKDLERAFERMFGGGAR